MTAESSESDVDANGQLADLSQLTVDDFEPLLNSEFHVELDYLGLAVDGTPRKRDGVYPPSANVDLELVEVTRRKPYPDISREPFALLFRSSHDLPLFGDVHVITHPTLGRLAILLTPVQVSPGTQANNHPEGRFYESVVS